jgi:hypothetical protein
MPITGKFIAQAPVVREGIGVDLRAIEIEYRRLWLSLLTSRTHSTSNGYCSAASLEDCCGVLHAQLDIWIMPNWRPA